MEGGIMRVAPLPSTKLTFSILLATVAVFIADILTPLGFAEAVLYLVPLLLSSFLLEPRLPIRLAGTTTVLVAAGFVLSPPGAPIAYAILNRTLAVSVLWTAAFGLRRLIQDRIAHLQAEQRWQLLAHQTNDILWDWDLHTNAHWWSENAIEALGYDPEHECSIEAWKTRLHPDDQTRVLTDMYAAIESDRSGWADEYRFLAGDGVYRTIFDRGAILRDKSGVAVRMIGAMIDISPQKQMQKALRESEERLTLAAHGSTDAWWDGHRLPGRLILDPDNPIWWSARIREILALDESTPFNTLAHWAQRLHSKDAGRVFAALQDHFERRTPFDVEYRIRTDRGEYRWIRARGQAIWDAHGEPQRMSGSCQDTTERKSVEKALRQSATRLKEAQRIGHIGSWELTLTGNTLTWSDETYRIFEINPEDIALSYDVLIELIHPDDRKMVHEAYRASVEARTPYDVVHRLLLPDGRIKFVRERCETQYASDGRPLRSTGTIQDITELKRADDALLTSHTAIRELYEVTSAPTRSFPEQVESILKLGCRRFGLPIGLLTQTNGDTAVIRIAHTSGTKIPTDAHIPLPCSPCSQAMTQSNPLQLGALRDSPFRNHFFRTDMKIETYFGVSVMIASQPYGTLCFLSTAVRQEPFNEADTAYLQLMARWISTALEREEALAALRNSEERKRAILNAALDGIVTIDAEERIIEFNPAAETIFGYARQAVLGHRVDDLIIPPALRERHRLGMAHCLATGSGPFFDRRVEITALRADGSEFPVELSLTRIAGLPSPLFTAFIRDLTERKKSETALLESEGRFRQLAESITEVFWLTTPEKRTMLYVSPAYETVWGKSCQSLYTDPISWLDAIHPDDRPRIAAVMQPSQTEGRYCEQYRIIRPDGAIRWIEDRAFPVKDDAGRITRIAGVARDITDRIDAETSLRTSEARLTEAQQIAGIGSWQSDADSKVFWSDETYRIFGYAPQSITPSYDLFVQTLHPDDRAVVADALRATLSHHAPYDVVCRILRPSGEQRHIRCRGAVTHNNAGAPIRVVGTVEDVSDRKRADDQLRQAYAQLQDATRHAAEAEENERRRIAREIHDELGQLLTAMRFQLTSLKKQRGADATREHRQDRDSRLNDLLDLSDSMLNQVRHLSTSLRPAILDELGLIPAVQAHARQFEIRTGIACDVVVDPALTDCPFDDATSSSVFRIIQELLTNVLRHAQAMAVTVSFATEGPELTATVRDNGSGIAPEQERHHSSFGLRGISERAALLGGTFVIGPSPAEGTVATLRIPMSVLAPAPQPTTPHQENHENPVGR